MGLLARGLPWLTGSLVVERAGSVSRTATGRTKSVCVEQRIAQRRACTGGHGMAIPLEMHREGWKQRREFEPTGLQVIPMKLLGETVGTFLTVGNGWERA